MELTEGDFKEMAPRIADRILLSFIQQAHRTDEAGKEGTTGPLTPKVNDKCITSNSLHNFFFLFF